MITGGEFETCTQADAALFGAGFGSAVDEVTFAEATIAEASGVAQSMRPTVSANVAVAPTGSEAMVQRIGPLPPAAGVVHVQPAGDRQRLEHRVRRDRRRHHDVGRRQIVVARLERLGVVVGVVRDRDGVA